jgi:tetratricopeptide (TPR) repeat protein
VAFSNYETAFKKAIELNPNYAEAHAYYSFLLNTLGRNEEALKQGALALKLDKNNPFIIGKHQQI